ncbi:MAG: hypothetical protein R3360_00830 [Alphaproteobacteria bacterium]|nr:hypothetical protein [Alphaproteobacteria bacterium]
MIALLVRISAICIFLTGVVTFPLPLPVGLFLMVLGLALFLAYSNWGREIVKRWRFNNRGADARIRLLARKLPAFLRRSLEITRPRRFGKPGKE